MDIETIDRNTKQGVEFTGNVKTKIILDKKSDRWTAVSLKDESVIMTLDTRVNMRAEQVIYKQYITSRKSCLWDALNGIFLQTYAVMISLSESFS